MLLTLTANALRSRIVNPGKSRAKPPVDALTLADVPRFAREHLGLHGLTLSTNLLVGADLTRLDALRDAADKASCPCLVLTESEPQFFGGMDEDAGDAAIERVTRVVRAAHRLGCNSVGLTLLGEDDEDTFDNSIERLRSVLSVAERLEINVLIHSSKGLTQDPERLTELIKKVGGFRIGTFPDFQAASMTSDPILHLRRLSPYASAITASAVAFKPGKKPGLPIHEGYDLVEYVKTVIAVGYQGTLAIDFRGEGDPVAGILNAKAVLESVVGSEDAQE
ncbi:MAG: sugar phosphate isomerase/epimerase family protein [Phycisphaerales bacterium]